MSCMGNRTDNDYSINDHIKLLSLIRCKLLPWQKNKTKQKNKFLGPKFRTRRKICTSETFSSLVVSEISQGQRPLGPKMCHSVLLKNGYR